MGNACVHLRNTGVTKMSFGFGAVSRPKEKLIFSTGLKMFVFERLSSVPFYLRHFVFSSSLSFFWFLR